MQASCHQSRPSIAQPAAPVLARAFLAALEWRRRSRSRRELAGLDDHALRDLGLDRTRAAFESGKSFLSR